MQLIIMRHATAGSGPQGTSDFDRPLGATGIQDARRMGRWMQQNGVAPDHILSSPSLRTRQTIEIVCEEIDFFTENIWWDKRVYLASLQSLLETLAETPEEMKSVMLTAHFPGVDELLTRLCGIDLPRAQNGALFTTATLAQVDVSSLVQLTPESGRLINLIRPKELPANVSVV